jgi:hypothetical protein
MRLRGRFAVGSLLPTIAPHLHGVHVRVSDARGALIVDEIIPGGSPSALQGWKASRNKWIYTDRAKPPAHNGISKVVIKNLLTLDPKLFSVLVQGNFGTYTVKPGDEPIRVTVELNAQAIPPGGTPGRDQCGEIGYLTSGRPVCTFVGFKVHCR